MSRITVFHDGKILAESDEWISSWDLPGGAYVHDARGDSWYRTVASATKTGGAMGINARDIPNWIKTWLLILS